MGIYHNVVYIYIILIHAKFDSNRINVSNNINKIKKKNLNEHYTSDYRI